MASNSALGGGGKNDSQTSSPNKNSVTCNVVDRRVIQLAEENKKAIESLR